MYRKFITVHSSSSELTVQMSVRYLPYHISQFVEGILGTVIGVLCNQALLVSVGISAEGSILGAVAVQWVIKDGAGEIAKLGFIRRYSPFFDRCVVYCVVKHE